LIFSKGSLFNLFKILIIPKMDYIEGVIKNKDSESLESILATGFDPNTKIPPWGRLLLIEAIHSKSIECVKILLKYKADVNPCLETSPLCITCSLPHIEMAKLLIEHKANVFISGDPPMQPLHYAVLSNNIEILRLITNTEASKNIDVKTRIRRHTGLQLVALYSLSFPVISLLLDNGAKISNIETEHRIPYQDVFSKRKNIKRTLIVFYRLGRKTKCLGKDVTNMIGKMVWETRDQDEWLMNQNLSKKYKK
jgi:ankyrin repeat protein